jgi:hypothetical protein
MTRADLSVLRRAAATGRSEAHLVDWLNSRKYRAVPATSTQAGVILANFALAIVCLLALLQPWI